MEYSDDITKLCCGEQILPVPWPFGISRFHCEYYLKATPDNISPGTKTISDRASAHTRTVISAQFW